MLVTKYVNTIGELAEFFRGTPVASGRTMTTAAASADVTGPAGAFTDVAEGDVIYISGEAGSYTVSVKTSDTALTLSAPVSATNTADAHWRAARGAFDPADLTFDPIGDGVGYLLAWEVTDFAV